MVRGTNKPLSDKQRLAALEALTERQQRTIETLLRDKPRTIPTGVTLAQTIDEDDYPTGSSFDFPAVFCDFNGSTITPRSESKQLTAYAPIPMEIPPERMLYVRPAIDGRWQIVNPFPCLALGIAGSGITAGATGVVTICDTDGAPILVDSEEVEVTVLNVFQTDIPADALVAYLTEVYSGANVAIAADCS